MLIENYVITRQIGPNKLLLITLAVVDLRGTPTLLNAQEKATEKESITNFRLRACLTVIMLLRNELFELLNNINK